MTIDRIMRAAPVIPVLVLDGDHDWAKLAETFVGAGLPVLEVTLRTPAALDAIRQMSRVPGAIAGAGTVLNEAQLAQAIDAGAQFIVSPGLTNPLALAAREFPEPGHGLAFRTLGDQHPSVAVDKRAGGDKDDLLAGSRRACHFSHRPAGGRHSDRPLRNRANHRA